MSNGSRIKKRNSARRRQHGIDVTRAERTLRLALAQGMPPKQDLEEMLDDVITQINEFEVDHPAEQCSFCAALLRQAREAEHQAIASGDNLESLAQSGFGEDLVGLQLILVQKWVEAHYRCLVALREAHMVSSG